MLSVHREYQLRNMKILKVCTVSKTVHAFCFIGNKKQAGAKNLCGLKSLTQSDILNDIADEAKEALCERISLEVRESNQIARHLYEKYDFIEISRRPRYYTNPLEDAIVMMKGI